MSRQKTKSSDTRASCSASCRSTKSSRSRRSSASARPSTFTACTRLRMRGSASRTHAASAARSDWSSLMSSFTCSSASARAGLPPLTPASAAAGRRSARPHDELFWRAAYVSPRRRRGGCMSLATFRARVGVGGDVEAELGAHVLQSRRRAAERLNVFREGGERRRAQRRISSADVDGGSSSRVNGSVATLRSFRAASNSCSKDSSAIRWPRPAAGRRARPRRSR